MKFGLSVPTIGPLASVKKMVEIAREAEEAGWDGVFTWDTMAGFPAGTFPPACDPWVALGAIAISTERVRIGPMVTPLARRRPWKVAREAMTVDRLSGGRMTLGVGLGNPPDDFSLFGEDADNRTRAAKLDEALDIITGLWTGEPFSYEGTHFRLENVRFTPPPAQQPRIPIWVGGEWPNKGPLRRAARFDGTYPFRNGRPMSVADVREAIEYVRTHRASDDPFEVVLTGTADKAGRRQNGPSLAEYTEAGATWWLNELGGMLGDMDGLREYVRNGPPVI